MGSGRLLEKMEDSRLESLMRIFPTKVEYAGFGASAAAAAIEAVLGAGPTALTLAVFAYFAAACLFGGALLAEGGRRGMRAEPLGWIENHVERDDDGDVGDGGR